MHTFRTDTRAPACVPVRCPQALEAGGAFSTTAHCSTVYDLEDEHAAEESEDEAYGGEQTEDDAKATSNADRVERAKAARAAVFSRLSAARRAPRGVRGGADSTIRARWAVAELRCFERLFDKRICKAQSDAVVVLGGMRRLDCR